MFSKDKDQNRAGANQPVAPAKPSPPSLVSRDLKVVGNLKSDGEIQIDGSVEGDIRCKTLLIGESAHIKGEIIAETVVVHGSLNGQIQSRSVTLASSAHVVGDILHENLSIETGAFLEGHCRRMEEEKPKTAAALPAATKADLAKDEKALAKQTGS